MQILVLLRPKLLIFWYFFKCNYMQYVNKFLYFHSNSKHRKSHSYSGSFQQRKQGLSTKLYKQNNSANKPDYLVLNILPTAL